ncbi:MAG TPA: ribokinase [Cyanothece sp. UBA12306]|nr:ribokinase [Cyanothece sp. UBA12306]
MSIIVFGSINMDLVAQTSRLPKAGETVLGNNFFTVPGGKGANQAVAAAKLGVKTYLIGRVGGDIFGEELLENLRLLEVNIDGVLIDSNINSGTAIITVEEEGENSIIVIPGANGNLDDSDVQRLEPILANATALLLQLEVPLSPIQTVANLAKKAGITVILDPAPAPDRLPDDLYPLIDIITPNETEAARLVGFPINNEEAAEKAAQIFLNWGVKTAIIKLGSKGAFYATKNQSGFIPPFPVKAINTVAAGDAFNGVMAAALDRGLSLVEALNWGAIAGALTTTKMGAQTALPNLEEVTNYLSQFIMNNQ